MSDNECILTIKYENIYELIGENANNKSIRISDDKNFLLMYLDGINIFSFNIMKHWHDWIELVYVTEGIVDITSGHRRISLSAGNLLYIPYGKLHSLYIRKNAKVCTLQISGIYLAQNYPWYNAANIECCTSDYLLSNHSQEYQQIISCFCTIRDLFDKTDKMDRLGFDAHIKLLLWILGCSFTIGNWEKSKNVNENRLITDMLPFIHQHYTENLEQSDISDQFSITPQHLSRLFKTTLGMTYTQYINMLRITKATYELEHTEACITDIMYDCGFPNKQSFLRVFKEHYNKTPSQYRKEHSSIINPTPK